MSIQPQISDDPTRTCQIVGTVSVVMVCKDSGETIGEAMRSVLQHLTPGDQLVAVDNGSSDQSLQEILEVADDDGRVVPLFIPSASDVMARKRGFRECSGRYVLFIEVGDVLLEGGIEQIRRAILANREAPIIIAAGSVPGLSLPGGGAGEPLPMLALNRDRNGISISGVRVPICAISWRRSQVELTPWAYGFDWADCQDQHPSHHPLPGSIALSIRPVNHRSPELVLASSPPILRACQASAFQLLLLARYALVVAAQRLSLTATKLLAIGKRQGDELT